jgi:predicted dienelactone hydrolase
MVTLWRRLRRSDASFQDPRIKAVFAIAPALGSGFAAEGLRHINVPVHIVVGGGDLITPTPTNAQRYASLIRGAKLTRPAGRRRTLHLPA